MKVVMKIEGKLENVFFELLKEAWEYHEREHTERMGLSDFSVSVSEEKELGFSLTSGCNNSHTFFVSPSSSLIYYYYGSRYGFIYSQYSFIFSKCFRINPRKIVLQKYSKQTISYKEWSKKEKAKEIIETIKNGEAFLEVKIGRKTVLAKITEYSSSAPKEWNLNPLEYIIYNENKPIGAIPMCVTKDNVPVNIEQLNKKQKQYIRFFD